MQMPNAARVRGMLANVLDEETELETIRNAVGSAMKPPDDKEQDEQYKEQLKRNWLACWTSITFKDLYGYPLWETQLHDILQASHPHRARPHTHWTPVRTSVTHPSHTQTIAPHSH